MHDNIVWGGPDGDGFVLIQDDTDGRQRVPLGTTGPRFVVADPEFESSATFQLSATSPAVDAAVGAALLDAVTPITGARRDLGAWEYIEADG